MSYLRIESMPLERPTPQYHTRGWQLIICEVGGFFSAAFGSLVTREFLTVMLPLIVLWELIPRLGIVPQKLVPLFPRY